MSGLAFVSLAVCSVGVGQATEALMGLGVGRSDVPFAVFLLSKQKTTSFTPITCQSSTSPDGLSVATKSF